MPPHKLPAMNKIDNTIIILIFDINLITHAAVADQPKLPPNAEPVIGRLVANHKYR